jgi:transglutaminase-like putative cysteine protease
MNSIAPNLIALPSIRKLCRTRRIARPLSVWQPLIARLVSFWFLVGLSITASAQIQNPEPRAGELAEKTPIAHHNSDRTSAPRYIAPREINWDFGMKITASGPGRGISGTVPLPLDWPEQTIEVEETHRPAQVSRVNFSRPTKDSRLMTFNISQLAAGESLEVYVRFKIVKRDIAAPLDTTRLKVPEQIPATVRGFLKPSPFIESNHHRIRDLAAELRDVKLSDWDQVEKVYRWVRERLQYEFDPTIRDCLEALDAGKGDCEEMSSLFIAICRAMKIPARAVLIPEHTYPEFFLVDENEQGYWFPCQLAGQYQFGSMTEPKPVLHKGDRFRVPGHSRVVRYLQPTLIEKSGQSQITIEWITRNNDPTPEQNE